jgi:methylase of polypeptide subunit release factors
MDDPLVPLAHRSRSRSMRRSVSHLSERILHVLGYYLVLRRPGTRVIQVAGFRLTVRPTVYDPRYGVAPPFFAKFVDGLDLRGKVVADMCTGSGIQALAAVRAGASRAVAIDINPAAAAAAAENARQNGFGDRVVAVVSNLFSAVAPGPHFDVILVNPPFCAGEAWDVADRAWRAGPAYRDIAMLFEQARERLAPSGIVYLVISSKSDLDVLGEFIRRARFSIELMSQQFILLETFLIYRLRVETAETSSRGMTDSHRHLPSLT